MTAMFKIWRGDARGGEFCDYTTEVSEGMVVLDAVNQIQATQARDLACRWNCKAGKCGSCSAEVNGMPKLMCMTRLSELPLEKPVTVEPMKAFPVIKDLVTDVSWNFRVKKKIKPFKPRPPDSPDGTWRMQQEDIDRVQEFRKCIAELKSLHKDAIPAALEKAERYRLLNEPGEAESICLDILVVDPENQQAIITLLLALTDRFEKGYAVSDSQTKELLARLQSEYDRAYYSGIVAERRAKMKLRQHTPGCRFQAYDFLREAMSWFERAEPLCPPGHDDAILRWNTCARIIERNKLVPREEEEPIEFPLE